MKIYNNLNISSQHKNSVIAIGNFDGIHKGHQKVLEQAKKKARKNKIAIGIVTFEPMPVMFFNSKLKNHRINSINQKKKQLKDLKIDFLIIIRFNKRFSSLSAEEFIKNIIYNKIRSKYVYVSNNFKFGKNRKGNTQTLKKFENIYNYKTIITEPLLNLRRTISSSLIRKKISLSKINEANKLLDRYWCVIGKVVKGKKRGRKIGFPTCNLDLTNYIVPKLGVYSAKVIVGKKIKKKSIVNIGYRPTFGKKKLVLEAHIFGLKKNLYDKRIKVMLIKFIRKEKRFKNIIQLKEQIKKDIRNAK